MEKPNLMRLLPRVGLTDLPSSAIWKRSDCLAGAVIAVAFGLAPAVLVLLTFDEVLTPIQLQARSLATPILLMEIAVIVYALLEGLKLPRIVALPSAALVMLLALAWVTVVNSPLASAGIIRTAIWTIHMLFGFSIVNLIRCGQLRREDFPPAIAFGFVVFNFLFVAFVVSVHRADYDWIDAMPAYSNIRWLGFYSTAVFGICAAVYTGNRHLYAAVAVLALGIAVWSGSRGTIYSILAGYTVAIALFPEMRSGWRRVAMIVAAGIAVGAALTAVLPMGMGAERLSDTSSSGRVEIWTATLPYIQLRPFFGWGEGQMLWMPQAKGVFVHPHNVILQVLLAWGMVGLAIIAGLSLWLARQLFPQISRDDLPFVLPVLMITAFSLIDGALFHVQSVATFVLLLSLLAAGKVSSRASISADGYPYRQLS
ncbi:O-antigen ligase family protein [Altererythrobacter sp. SALINAS58]|uniref:O-antigen ligase family protein n=1 Tax=Alteripontixanthobacter muriae TaxID=2705546 RepID=UPI0015763FD2|nr:O-antigen ligase family protein [Alteripontixanthobacter muriae]NTZ42073.1 O-antigen ligase family protein [Alteripontixanthobacter muriae]